MNFKKNKTFRYLSYNDNGYANMVPSNSVIPQWYKNMDKYNDKYPPKDARTFAKSVKSCFPFLDALTSGYMITTSHDIVVSLEARIPELSWSSGGTIIGTRKPITNEKFPEYYGHHATHFIWVFPITFVVPEGYSALVTHPLNRYDLPFTTMSGVLDGPYVLGEKGNLPFFLKKDFEGLIPQGTPIAQILPFKRESWKSIKDETLKEEATLNAAKSLSVLKGWYKSTYWNKKHYE